MNLVAYDIVKGINRNTTWIDTKYKKLYSREIKARNFYGFSKTFNAENNSYDLCLILTDVNTNDGSFVKVIDRYQPLKIPLNRIWTDISLYITETTNINIKLIDKSDDCDIYLIDI